MDLAPGEEKTVEFTLDKRSFAYYHTGLKDWYVESGDFTILAGKSSRDIQLSGTVTVESTTQVKKVFHMNSTFGDVMADPKGRKIISQMLESMDLGGVGGEAIAPEALQAMLGYLPLRGALMMAGDMVKPEKIQGLIDTLNA